MSSTATIPADWTVQSLDDVTTRIQDGTHFSPALGGSDRRYITSKNIGAGRLRLDSVEMISEAEHRKIYQRCEVRRGDLLLTKDGANTGNAAINSFKDEISLLSSVAFIRSNPSRSTEEYLLQYLLSYPGKRQIADLMAGNAITRLTLAKIKALEVPMPSVGEQHRIAGALRDADDLIASVRRAVAKRTAIRQGMMQQLLTRRARLSSFSDAWQSTRIGEFASFSKGSGLAKSDLREDGLLPCIHYGELFTQYGPLIRSVRSRTNIRLSVRSQIGDVLMPTSDVTPRGLAKASSIQQSGVGLGADVLIIRPDITVVDSGFLAYAIRGDERQVLSLVKGSTVFHLYGGDMRGFLVDLPPLAEQKAIARVLADADLEIDALNRRADQAGGIKQAMLQELITGRTRLPRKDAVA